MINTMGLTDEAKKLGHDVYVVSKIEGAIVRSYENEWRIYNSDDKKGFVIDPEKSPLFVVLLELKKLSRPTISIRKN